MRSPLKRMDVEAAKEDLKNRSLAQLGYDFARLLYLSSLRDFGTGEYHHHGLALCFSEPVARGALSACHQELFYGLALAPLESFVAQIDRFLRSTPSDYQRVLNAWEGLEALNTTIPSVCDPMTAELFRSNLKVAIMLLKSPRSTREQTSPRASPPPSLGR